MSSPVFILSTGRTGTQFFEEYVNGTSSTTFCKHEPKPSRRFKFLSNLYLNGKAGTRFIKQTYLRSRKGLFRKHQGKAYIESSNFLFGCIPALNELYPEIKIIHIVRHPVEYVKSHLNHGFWRGHKKLFAKHVPYWIEKLELSNPSDPIELLTARWNYVNRQIQSYADSNAYLLVRFEDLFSGDLHQSSSELNKIREFCGLGEVEEEVNASWLQKPKNRSVRSLSLDKKQEDLILKGCHDLMKEYKYIS